jgi:DNA-binding NarL/FixJ family response regulator
MQEGAVGFTRTRVRFNALVREASPPVRVLVCSPIPFYREGLADALRALMDVEVVGTASLRQDCIVCSIERGAEVVLLDLATPDSLATIRELVAAMAGVKVVALAVPEEEQTVIACAEAGVAGYVTREETLEGLKATLRVVARDGSDCPPRLAGFLLRKIARQAEVGGAAEPGAVRLTRREDEVLALLSEGLSNKQIARRLCIELPTVKNHVHHILEKLSVRHRGEAVAWLRASAVRR